MDDYTKNSAGDFYATDRAEDDFCERNTQSCSIDHTRSGLDSQCDT